MKKITLQAYDIDQDKWISSNQEGTRFVLENGKWKVYYTTEITKRNGDIEMDVPVEREVDEPEVEVVNDYFECHPS